MDMFTGVQGTIVFENWFFSTEQSAGGDRMTVYEVEGGTETANLA